MVRHLHEKWPHDEEADHQGCTECKSDRAANREFLTSVQLASFLGLLLAERTCFWGTREEHALAGLHPTHSVSEPGRTA
jgi:hypothetical protein